MADGQLPDQSAALAQLQAALSAQASNNGAKGAPILAGVLPSGGKDVDVGSGLSLKGKGLNSDSMINRLPQGKPGLLASLKQQMGLTGNQMFDDIRKVAQNAGVMYSGEVTKGSSLSNNAPGGGGGGVEIG